MTREAAVQALVRFEKPIAELWAGIAEFPMIGTGPRWQCLRENT